MKYRYLGSTGLKISEIGFGSWGIGGSTKSLPAYGPTNDRESTLTLMRAYDLGVTFYDTADVYGSGHSEQLIGQAFKDVRHKVVIATKVGMDSVGGEIPLNQTTITTSLDASLRRLQTDYVDLYQLHAPDIDNLIGNDIVFSTMEKLVKDGKVRAFGVTVKCPDDGLLAIENLGFKSVQVNFNLTDQRAQENGLFDLCERKGVGVIARTPLCFGFLTQSYSGDTKFDSLDHRSNWPPEQLQRWAVASQEFTEVLANHQRQTNAQIALRFCLSFQAVSSTIPGMLSRAHVNENVPSADMGPLSNMEIANITEVYRNNVFFLGKTN